MTNDSKNNDKFVIKTLDEVYIMVYIKNIGDIYANCKAIFEWQEPSCQAS